MIRRPPRSTQNRSSAASDVYKRQYQAYSVKKKMRTPTSWTMRKTRMRTKVPTDDISIDSLLAYYYKYVANLGESAKELLIDKETGKLNVITSYNRMHGYHAQTLKTLEERLNSGWSSIEILGRLQDAKCGGVKAQSIGDIIPSKKPVANRADEELLDPDCKYRHPEPVSYTHLRAHETVLDLVCRLLLEKKKKKTQRKKKKKKTKKIQRTTQD